jgi:hypothetical protein
VEIKFWYFTTENLLIKTGHHIFQDNFLGDIAMGCSCRWVEAHAIKAILAANVLVKNWENETEGYY